MAAVWSPCDPPPMHDIFAEREEEQIKIDVQSRILHSRDVDLADIVLLNDDVPGSVDDAARRVLGAIIRSAAQRMTATLTDDERSLVAWVREVIADEVRDER